MNNKFLPLILLFFIGCKTNFFYNYPKQSQFSTSGPVLGITPIEDIRAKGKRTIDKSIKENIVDMINKVIFNELKSIGIFKSITVVTKNQVNDKKYLEQNNIDFLLIPKLAKFEWSVPDYDSIVTKITIISVLTGGIGGLIYGMTSTDVYGYSELEIKLLKNNKKVIYESIEGTYKENMSKLSCDTLDTKAKMVGMALKKAMIKINRILKKSKYDL